MRAKRADGGVEPRLCYLPSTPQSIAKPSPGWNKVALLTAVRNSPCFCPSSVSLHPPLAAFNSEPRPGSLLAFCNHHPKAVPVYGESGTKCRKGNGLEMLTAASYSPPQLRLRSAERWLEYGRLAARLLHMCQDMRVNALVGTRSPYSLPFVILPVPARSPFRFIRHRRRSTPNLVASPTGRARLESPARGGAFWCALQTYT